MNRIRAGFINVSCLVIFSAAGLSIISDSVAQDADNPALLEADVNQSEDQIIGSIAEAGVNISKDAEQSVIGEGKKIYICLKKHRVIHLQQQRQMIHSRQLMQRLSN